MENHEPEDLRSNPLSALALFSALCFLPIPAIVLGIIGATQAKRRHGFETGERMGAAAQLLGLIELFAAVAIWVFMSSR